MKAKNILIIEDSPTQSVVLAGIVSSLGYEARVFHNLPRSVSQILSEVTPEMVLLDLRLLDSDGNSVGDGFQICREVKKLEPETPVIIVSSEDINEAGEWAKMQGADAFLQKPFVPEDLKRLIKDLSLDKL
jgi:CheY-like chemotaxis protein